MKDRWVSVIKQVQTVCSVMQHNTGNNSKLRIFKSNFKDFALLMSLLSQDSVPYSYIMPGVSKTCWSGALENQVNQCVNLVTDYRSVQGVSLPFPQCMVGTVPTLCIIIN